MEQKENKGISRRDFLRYTVLSGATIGASLTLAPGLTLSHAADKGKWVMKYDCYIGQTAETAQLDNWFLDEIVKRTDGRIQVKKFWASSLHKVGEHLPAVKNGLSELSLISYGYYPSDVPLTRGLDWYFRGCDHADALLHVCRDIYNETPELRKEWEERNNSQVLYFTNWGYGPFMMKKPLPDLESMKGLKIRGYGIGADTISRLGGQGMPVVAGETYTSLEQGILDGAFSFAFVTAEKMKIHEQAPYIIEAGAGAHAPSTVIMNRKLWLSLPDDIKEIIQKTADDIYNKIYLEIYTKLMEESLDATVKFGCKFSIWPQSEIEKAKKLVQPSQVEVWINEVKALGFDGKAFQNKVDQLIAKYEKTAKLKNPWEVYKAKYGA